MAAASSPAGATRCPAGAKLSTGGGHVSVAGATIGAANAGAGPTREPVALPLDPGGNAERRAVENLLYRARERGLVGARLFGHVATLPPHVVEAVHASAGLVAFGAAALGFEAGSWLLVLIALSSALRALGVPCLDVLLPRCPSWTLVLRPCCPGTRILVATVTDRARLAPRLPFVTLAAIAVALLTLAWGGGAWMVGVAGLASVVVVSTWLVRPARAEPNGPEEIAARALFRFAEQGGTPDTAVILAGGASARGRGIAAVLDWWGLRPGEVEVHLVVPPGADGAPAASTLARAGWRVRTLLPDELRSPP